MHLELTGRKAEDVTCVFSGAGAAAMACASLFLYIGVRPENLILCDSRGPIYKGRTDGMNPCKRARLAVITPHRTLKDALVGADVFVGVSLEGALSHRICSEGWRRSRS